MSEESYRQRLAVFGEERSGYYQGDYDGPEDDETGDDGDGGDGGDRGNDGDDSGAGATGEKVER